MGGCGHLAPVPGSVVTVKWESGLVCEGGSTAWVAWPVGKVGMRRGSSSAAGQAVINMMLLGVNKGRPAWGSLLPPAEHQESGDHSRVSRPSPSQCMGNPVVALYPA